MDEESESVNDAMDIFCVLIGLQCFNSYNTDHIILSFIGQNLSPYFDSIN